MRSARWLLAVVLGVVLGVLLAGCGSSDPAPGEVSPSGDIPDTQAFVPYTAPDGSFTVSVPEGWSRSTQGTAVVFTSKLDSVRIEAAPAPAAPTPASAGADVAALAASTPGFVPGAVTTTDRAAGPAVLVTYQALSPVDPVTGKATTDAVERYRFWHAGQEVDLVLSGPTGADNVDPWRQVTDSLRWLR